MRRRNVSLLALILLAGAATACDSGNAAEDAAIAALPQSFDSSTRLARAVLDAVENGDREALLRMRVSREQHRDLLWEQLPESERIPFEFAAGLNDANTRKSVDEILDRFGDDRYELLDVVFREEPEVYDGFTLHMGARLLVRRLSDGRVGELPVLDVVVERQGRWAPLNYDA